MITRLRKLFTIQTEFQKYIQNSSLLKDNYVFKQEDIENLMPFLQDAGNIEEFLQYYLDDQSYTIKMKLLITSHFLIAQSDEFAQVFLQINFTQFSKSQDSSLIFKSSNSEQWLYDNIQLPFFQYLQKVAFSMEDIRSYKNHHFRKQQINQSLVIDCFKLENLVNHGLSLIPQLKTALNNFPHDFLLKRLASSLYSELRMFQKQLINSLSALLDQNSKATNIEIYEFFREVQLIEKKTMQFYLMHKLFDPARKLMPPLQLKIDIKSAKHLEMQAQHEQQKLTALKQQRSQRLTRAYSSDFQNKGHQGFISQREKKFLQHNRAKKQETIQEANELPTEEQQQQIGPTSRRSENANLSDEGEINRIHVK
ncbi:hypothetical protein pb186bvf_009146 [Paramecium bursaria]